MKKEELENKINPAQIIADLYVYRSKMIRPMNYREMQNPQQLLQYNFLNAIIANLSDKYKVKYEDIKEALNNPAN
jgi:hypothetical protein